MKVDINLTKDFERFFNVLNENYGEDFADINGLSEEKLSFTDFINNFSKKKTVADASVDGSSNVKNKDIVTLRSEMSKPHEKLLAYNKIFLEMKQIFGLRKAKKWLELEWNKALYLHDANTATFVPYSYKGSECIHVRYKGIDHYTTFEQLFDLVEEPIELLSEDDCAYCKYTDDLFVLDKIDKKSVWTKVIRVIRKPRTNDFHFIRSSNGLSEIVTDNHPVITKNGDINAADIKDGDEIYTYANDIWFGDIKEVFIADKLTANSINERLILNGKIISDDSDKKLDSFIYRVSNNSGDYQAIRNHYFLDEYFGYIIGLAVTDGSYNNGCLHIAQRSGAIKDKLIYCCERCLIPYKVNEQHVRVGNKLFVDFLDSFILPRAAKENKCLHSSFINYNIDFIKGIVAGMLDGDGSCPKAWDHTAGILLQSRALTNQFSYMLRALGYKSKDMRPRVTNIGYNGEVLDENKVMYEVRFNIYHDSITLPSVKFNSREWVKLKEDCEIHPNKRYTFDYDDAYVYGNIKLDDKDMFVYDISTETGHFICNNILSHNCFAYDLTKLAEEGLFYLDKHDKPEPAQHLETFVDFVKEFINFTSNRTSGACGLPNLIPYMYYYWKKDIDSDHYPRCQNEEQFAKSQIQRIIYGMNQPYTRDGIQSAFVNTSIFDSEYFDALFGGASFPNGEFMIDHKQGILQFEKWFLEEMAAIKDRGRMFTFPVNSISLLKKDGKFIDEEFARWCSNHNRKWNDSNIFADSSVTSLSNCCRLKSNIKDLGYFNSIGGSALKVGSVKVSTINLARIAYECNGKEKKFLDILKDRLIINMEMLHTIRHIIKRNVEKNLLPNFQDGIIDFEHLYNTVGINGIYEVMKTFGYTEVDALGYTKYTDDAMNFGKAIFDVIHATIQEFAADKDYMVNVEQIPGETAALRFLQADKLLYPEETVTDLPLYGNQWIPLGIKTTLKERIRICAIFDDYCNGGSICHINLDAPIESEESAWDILDYITNQGVTYSALNGNISSDGEHLFHGNICPICGKEKTSDYTRTVGFYTETSSWSSERKEEYKLRDWHPLNEKGIEG